MLLPGPGSVGGPCKDIDAAITGPVRIMNEILGLRTYASREGHQEPANPHAAIPPGSEEPLQEGESFISCISFYLPVREHG